jgi:DNA end-binding protein Ku
VLRPLSRALRGHRLPPADDSSGQSPSLVNGSVIAKVVIKTRQHLAAIKPQSAGLMLELMHFPEELLDLSEFKSPAVKTVGKAELTMAKQLITSMSDKWHPEMFRDDYHELLEKVVEKKIHAAGKASPKTRKSKPSSQIIDLASILQQSIQKAESGGKSRTRKAA